MRQLPTSEPAAHFLRSFASSFTSQPDFTARFVALFQFDVNDSWVGYSAGSVASLNSVVVPKRRQRIEPPCSPVNAAIGTSTWGVRMPPSALPLASWLIATGGPALTSRRGADLGALRVRTQWMSLLNAAFRTKCCGPELIGVSQWMSPGMGSVGTTTPAPPGEVPLSVVPTARP